MPEPETTLSERQSGLLQGYGVGMLIGVTAILILILMSTGPFAILGWFGW